MPSFWEVQRLPSNFEGFTHGELQDDMATYVSQPNEPGRHPAVIVIQEVFGINADIQAITDRAGRRGVFRGGSGAVPPGGEHRRNQGDQPVVQLCGRGRGP